MLNPNLVFHERCANKLCTMSWHIFLCTMSRHLSAIVYRSDQAFGRSLERREATPLDHALQAAGNEAFSVLCRLSA